MGSYIGRVELAEGIFRLMNTGLFLHWAPLLLAAGGLLIAIIIVVRYKVPALTERVKAIELTAHIQEVTKQDLSEMVKKTELYESDGSYRYQHVGDCKMFQGIFCGKIDEVKTEIGIIKKHLHEMDKSREKAREDLVKTMTRVETMIQTDRTQELKKLANMIVSRSNGIQTTGD